MGSGAPSPMRVSRHSKNIMSEMNNANRCKKKKGNTDRLWKAMGLPAPKGTKVERDTASQNIALGKIGA